MIPRQIYREGGGCHEVIYSHIYFYKILTPALLLSSSVGRDIIWEVR